MLMVLPRCKKSSTEILLPTLWYARNDSELLSCKKSITEQELPKRAIPIIETADPVRAMFRRDSEDPRWRKSSTESDDPSREYDRRDRDDPSMR
jgi:hypothetical protein